MDWFVDAASPDAVGSLRREFTAYLDRHAEPGSDLEGARLTLTELISNTGKHAKGYAWVHVDWSGEAPELLVRDLGPGFDPEIELPEPTRAGGRGLYLVSRLGSGLRIDRRRAGGAEVSVVLPVRRRPERSYDPPRRRADALPAPEEASLDGTFGKESFLRALVVELAQHIEHEQGPDAAEAAVAQVGASVGGRMEDEYRRARGVVGRLEPEQMADLYVRLKHAIDGDFHVEEATAERIVLTSTRCPFGEVVRRAPALCRMTSSVFGSIAAENADGSYVQLEERIAVGDPGCRVVVWLGRRPERPPHAHAYPSPEKEAVT